MKQDIFASTDLGGCGAVGCHASGSANLDLVSDGVETRLVGQESPDCAGEIFVVAGDPSSSYLMEKLTSSTPACGGKMPLGGSLSDEELACVEEWILAQ